MIPLTSALISSPLRSMSRSKGMAATMSMRNQPLSNARRCAAGGWPPRRWRWRRWCGVDDDVDDEHDVHDEVHHVERAAGVAAVSARRPPLHRWAGRRRSTAWGWPCRSPAAGSASPTPPWTGCSAALSTCGCAASGACTPAERQRPVTAPAGRQRPERLLKQEVFPKTVRWIANQKNAKDGEE